MDKSRTLASLAMWIILRIVLAFWYKSLWIGTLVLIALWVLFAKSGKTTWIYLSFIVLFYVGASGYRLLALLHMPWAWADFIIALATFMSIFFVLKKPRKP